MGSTSSREMANRMERFIDKKTYGQSLDDCAKQVIRRRMDFCMS